MPNAVLARMVAERDRISEQIDDVLARVEGDERDPSEAERELLTRQRSRLDELEPQIVELVELEERRADSRDARTALARAASAPAPATPAPTAPEAGAGTAVYRTFAEYARDELIKRYDSVASRAGIGARDAAVERLTRAVQTVITSDVAGLLPPTHIAQIMQTISTARPLVEASRRLSLTSGKLTYPRVTTRPQVAVQTAEKTEAGNGDMGVVMEDVVAKTYLAAANMSWQTINWATPDALSLWFDLAAESYAAQTEAEVGTLLAAVTQTVELASNDLPGWTAAIAAAAGAVHAITKSNPNVLALAGDVGYALVGYVSAAQPVFLMTGQGNLANGTGPSIGGLRTVISAGLPPGTAVVGNFSQLLTAETPGAPVELRAVEPSIAGMEIGIVGAFAAELVELPAFCKIVNAVPLTARSGRGSKSGD